ncbi:MAG: metallophosphoesterase [bacterium]
MQKRLLFIWLTIVVFSLTGTDAHAWGKKDKDWSFFVAADMRYWATEEYRNSKYFLGALEAMKKVGNGQFLISPGDIDPPYAVRECVDIVFGEEYPWYPVIGNHELAEEEYLEYLRHYNDDGVSLPNLVRTGPPGSEATTYSFDWGNSHFAVINQYYDGVSDAATEGRIVPEILDWLERDLSESDKPLLFVIGHEPIISLPDMDSGRLRHVDDILTIDENTNFQFHQLLLKHRVVAYLCGHTHNTSYGNLNGVWQIDSGHARGIEDDPAPQTIYEDITECLAKGYEDDLSSEQSVLKRYMEKKSKYDGWLRAEGLSEESPVKALLAIYQAFKDSTEMRQEYIDRFWANSTFSRSTFLRIVIKGEGVKVEFYRNNGFGGPYELTQTVTLR